MESEFLVQRSVGSRRRSQLKEVRSTARHLRDALAGSGVSKALGRIAPIGGTSHAVDAIVRPVAESLGFTSQKDDLFLEYPIRLRPDWYRRVGRSGILLEVERGKTLANNMDLLDLWKCHICREADHLFLVVPLKVQRTNSVENVYSRVVNRMETFMEPENRVNVVSIAVLGYP
jgi:hypothetical protein